MKVAISGKGGVGKTTLCATLARLFADEGREVYLVKMKQLIAERTGASPDEYGKVFKLNPEVADLPEKYSVNIGGIKLLVLGTIYKGGSGCACPENTLLRSLMLHFFLERDANVLLDMEAGIEHIKKVSVVGNKFANESQRAIIRERI
jgi:CO dehydrogenase maturation factor